MNLTINNTLKENCFFFTEKVFLCFSHCLEGLKIWISVPSITDKHSWKWFGKLPLTKIDWNSSSFGHLIASHKTSINIVKILLIHLVKVAGCVRKMKFNWSFVGYAFKKLNEQITGFFHYISSVYMFDFFFFHHHHSNCVILCQLNQVFHECWLRNSNISIKNIFRKR